MTSHNNPKETTMTTKTHYATESHKYLENVPCDNPKICTKRSHWEHDTDEHDTLAEARDSARNANDAPAVRIIKVRTVIEEEQAEVISA